MAFVDLGAPIVWPLPQVGGGNTTIGLALSLATFDSTSDRLAYVGRSPVTDTLTTVYIRTANITAGSTIDVRIETVSNGEPTGTLFGTNTNVNVVVADGDDNVWKTATLTSGASMNRGDQFAIVVTNASGTPNSAYTTMPGGVASGMGSTYIPVCLQDTGGGTWAAQTFGWEWIVQFSTAGVIYMPGLCPCSGAGTLTAFNSGTTPDERALRFQIDAPVRVFGLRVPLANIAAGADFTISLWPASSTTDGDALAQVAYDGDIATSTTADGFVDAYFATPVELAADTTYYIGVRADTANNISTMEMSNSTVTNAMRAFGVNAQTYLATRSWTAGSAGAWTTTTTTLLMAYLLIDQIHDGAGGGSSSAVANIRGNFQ